MRVRLGKPGFCRGGIGHRCPRPFCQSSSCGLTMSRCDAKTIKGQATIGMWKGPSDTPYPRRFCSSSPKTWQLKQPKKFPIRLELFTERN